MRKNILTLYILAMLTAACSSGAPGDNGDNGGDNGDTGGGTVTPIAMSPVVTRADHVSLQSINSTFGGWCYKTPWQTTAGRTEVMNNVTVTWSDQLTAWDYTTKRYWDMQADYEFYGYSPYSAAATVSISDNTDDAYTANNNLVKRIAIKGITMGDAVGDRRATDWLLAQDVTDLKKPVDGTIHLVFDHLMAHVVFCLYADNEGSTLAASGSKITKADDGDQLICKADFKEGAARVPAGITGSEWTAVESNDALAPFTMTEGVIPGPPEETEKQQYLYFVNMLMIPQCVKKGLMLTVNVAGELKTVPVTTSGKNSDDAVFKVESGKEYVFYVKLNTKGALEITNVLQIDNFTADDKLWEEEE